MPAVFHFLGKNGGIGLIALYHHRRRIPTVPDISDLILGGLDWLLVHILRNFAVLHLVNIQDTSVPVAPCDGVLAGFLDLKDRRIRGGLRNRLDAPFAVVFAQPVVEGVHILLIGEVCYYTRRGFRQFTACIVVLVRYTVHQPRDRIQLSAPIPEQRVCREKHERDHAQQYHGKKDGYRAFVQQVFHGLNLLMCDFRNRPDEHGTRRSCPAQGREQSRLSPCPAGW